MTYYRYLQMRGYVGCIILFMVSVFYAWQDVKYAIWGKTADATIVSVKKVVTTEHRYPVTIHAVRYRWMEDGKRREDVMNRSMDWRRPEDGIIQIDYLPVVKGSRAHGERHTGSLLLCGGLLLAMAVWSIKIFHDAYGRGAR